MGDIRIRSGSKTSAQIRPYLFVNNKAQRVNKGTHRFRRSGGLNHPTEINPLFYWPWAIATQNQALPFGRIAPFVRGETGSQSLYPSQAIDKKRPRQAAETI